ncbi:MAG: phosphoribosylpyrophosphate synthetase [Bacteroidetes bacterium]|nr:phosphoribosylpyrophosphate synthetase [Bacteroidota bacterium]
MSLHTYNTLAEAVIALKERGYEIDMFELIENSNDLEQFTIVETHHFEGILNPVDNSVLYVIESSEGLKGIVIDLNGINHVTPKTELLSKIKVHPTV